MYNITPDITEDYVLKHLSQEQIMEHYLGLPIKLRKKFRSPFRKDQDPSCSMTYREGKLIFTDFGGTVSGNCFHIVMHRHQCNYYEALEKIAKDFDINGVGNAKVPKVEYTHLQDEKRACEEQATIQIKRRKWRKVDKGYWYDRFGIRRKELDKFNVYPVQVAWLNGSILYNHSDNDPCYAYRLGKGEYKLYFPTRYGKGAMRFIHNTQRVQGYRQLPKTGKHLVLTKSLKDVMVLDLFDVPSVALPSESCYPPEGFIEAMQKRFEHIHSLYDYDYAGIKMANYLKRTYGIKVLMLHPEEKAKDISEYFEKNGKEKTREIVELVTNHIETLIEEENEIRKDIPYW
ncbi:CHC2 zinc finger domain-containing protein [Zeaxanthinibacter sp. PT1]|uniref:CHC2 zinc finger domain-containing protein n=1 Tax=Zeaxanthinibacter TaxID=561554 RepID=UPI00234A9BB4|nr:CHC2 zinc finger domain-containing protein [Zeaxanthinibacter sp. PT1]MDC6350726.1 CHC2 zinc finger domain-containing protein [Zeaxanthinibacter sp. PT1]